jgi:hypothetical protein
METLDYVVQKFGIDLNQQRMPIEIPGVGRNDLAKLFAELGFRRGVEIGVEAGLYSEVIMKANPGVEHYSIDPWKAYAGYRDHVNQQKIDGFHAKAKERLEPLGGRLIKAFSGDAVHQFKDYSLDYVYIDGNHNCYHCINDLYWWSKKVRFGGIIAGHDYVTHRRPTGMHVVQAVNAWTDSWDVRPWFILGSKAMVDGVVRDESRSFFWVTAPVPKPRRNQQ